MVVTFNPAVKGFFGQVLQPGPIAMSAAAQHIGNHYAGMNQLPTVVKSNVNGLAFAAITDNKILKLSAFGVISAGLFATVSLAACGLLILGAWQLSRSPPYSIEDAGLGPFAGAFKTSELRLMPLPYFHTLVQIDSVCCSPATNAAARC